MTYDIAKARAVMDRFDAIPQAWREVIAIYGDAAERYYHLSKQLPAGRVTPDTVRAKFGART